MQKIESCEVNAFYTTSTLASLTPTPLSEKVGITYTNVLRADTGYHLLENYDINYVHESYHYSQLFDVVVDQASPNRLEI